MGRHSISIATRRASRRSALSAAAGVAGLATLGLAGCSSMRSSSAGAGPVSDGSPQPGGIFHHAETSDTRLDPQTIGGGISAATPAFSRAFRFQSGPDPATCKIEPDLAVSAESPNAITWTLKLRPDAKFHNVPPVNGPTISPC
jgi:peptide/nickel transport system substrate-binding protein